jgi:hypothetical protein
MEKVLTINNGESNWSKLATFGLHSRGGHIGFNRYSGKNSQVMLIDPATGMRVMLIQASIPRTERAPKADRTPMKRGRPAIHTCVQHVEGKKLGRPAVYSHPIMFREPIKRGRKPFTAEQKAEREAIKAELSGLVFYNHPMRKRGPKPSVKDGSETLNGGTQSVSNSGKRRGRVSEADRIKQAKKGQIITSKGGSWLMVADGLGSWIAA